MTVRRGYYPTLYCNVPHVVLGYSLSLLSFVTPTYSRRRAPRSFSRLGCVNLHSLASHLPTGSQLPPNENSTMIYSLKICPTWPFLASPSRSITRVRPPIAQLSTVCPSTTNVPHTPCVKTRSLLRKPSHGHQ